MLYFVCALLGFAAGIIATALVSANGSYPE